MTRRTYHGFNRWETAILAEWLHENPDEESRWLNVAARCWNDASSFHQSHFRRRYHAIMELSGQLKKWLLFELPCGADTLHAYFIHQIVAHVDLWELGCFYIDLITPHPALVASLVSDKGKPVGPPTTLFEGSSSARVGPVEAPQSSIVHADVPSRYQGWANYETWTARLWLDNCERSYRHWRQVTQSVLEVALKSDEVAKGYWSAEEAPRILLANRLNEDLRNRAPDLGATMYADLLNSAFDDIDWLEIADSLLEDHAHPTPKEVVPAKPLSRTEAIANGDIIDVADAAHEVGVAIPVNMTRAAWMKTVAVPDAHGNRDEAQRLRQVLESFLYLFRRTPGCPREIRFQVPDSNNAQGGKVDLVAESGPGDDCQAVMTISLQDEM